MSLTKGSKASHTAPRVRTTPTKAERKLAARQAVYDTHGKNPQNGRNPSNSSGQGCDMHRPGSQNRNKRV